MESFQLTKAERRRTASNSIGGTDVGKVESSSDCLSSY